ncbi:hypothetical protein [Amycolatopsis tolypomycina]|uniref:hypothetical protein n=1 Tax=Amycolatopsis tolypomycina TaxID=208445 RepID=UPI00142D27F1|nr:hypothetical protein [Amycolatopsis tolypomycina]
MNRRWTNRGGSASSISATAASSTEMRLRPSASSTGWSPPSRNRPVRSPGAISSLGLTPPSGSA